MLEERFGEEVYLKGGPRMVLERFLPVMETGSWKWTMGGYFKKWMDSNSDQAIPWLAKHVDEMPNLSFGFLEVSFHSLLASSPETASRLLEVIPPERRLESLRSLSNRAMPEASQIAWAEVVREHIPEAITWPIMNWSDGDGSPFTMDFSRPSVLGRQDPQVKQSQLASARRFSACWFLVTTIRKSFL